MDSQEPVSLTAYVPNEPYGKSVGAVHRGLEMLELFAVEQCPLTVSQIAAKLGYPQSSTSVLLHGLHNLGYLAYDRASRTFFPTVRVTFLGMWMHHHILNEGSLLRLMEELARATGHVALLAIRNGLYAQYMHIVSARESRVGMKPGLMRPICRAAVGKVLLSRLADDEIRRVVRHANAVDETALPPVDAEQLLQDISRYRETGFAYSQEAVTAGSSVIATRIPIEVAGVPLAIGVGVHANEFDDLRDHVETLLRKTVFQHFQQARPDAAGAARVRQGAFPYAVGQDRDKG